MHIWDDREIILALAEGSETAFRQFYDHYSPQIFKRLLKLLKDVDVVDEIIQEVFLKVWYKKEKLLKVEVIKPYLYKIAENLVYDYFRKLSRDKTLQERFKLVNIHRYSHIEEDLLDKENRQLIDAAIQTLPAQRRLAFTLCRIEGISYEEAAQMMGISTSTVSNHLVLATKSVKKYVEKHGNFGLIIPCLIFLYCS